MWISPVAHCWGNLTELDGTKHKSYADDYVRCYHSEDRDHMAVYFGDKSHGRIEIQLHPVPTINSTVGGFCDIDIITENAARLFKEEVVRRAKISQEEKSRDRDNKIKALKKELAIIEGREVMNNE